MKIMRPAHESLVLTVSLLSQCFSKRAHLYSVAKFQMPSSTSKLCVASSEGVSPQARLSYEISTQISCAGFY